MNCVVRPVLDGHHSQLRTVTENEFDVLREGSAAALVDHERRLGELRQTNLGVSVGDVVDSGAGHGDHNGLLDLDLGTNRDDRCRLEARIRLRCNAISGNAGFAQTCVVTADGLDGDVASAVDLDGDLSVGDGAAVVQSPEATQRGEPPDLVTSAGNLESIDVERGELLTLVRDG